MKKFLHKGSLFLLTFLTIYTLKAQNPNWTMPPYIFDSEAFFLSPLPTSVDYFGVPSTNLDAAYSDDDGNLIFFTVDENVFDKNGILVDDMRRNSYSKKGHSERLMLPLGNDCQRYAIIYQASLNDSERYTSKLDQRRLYMAVYDLNAANPSNPASIGALDYDGTGQNLIDISLRDATLYGLPADPSNPFIYGFNGSGHQGYRANYQIAATELIDNCFYYVFIFDGLNLIRYKLNELGLQYDSYVYSVPNSDLESDLRSEMELIKLSNGNYRIAIPKNPYSIVNDVYNIGIMDINGTTGDVIGTSYQEISLGSINGEPAEPYGIEFNATGQYLYFTHSISSDFPNTLEVYDCNSATLLSTPTLTGITNFRNSFIERSGDEMFLASDNYIGKLTNLNSPTSLLSFDPVFTSIPGSGYGNSLGAGGSSRFFRYMLPDQLDFVYTELSSMSCDCCARFNSAQDIVEVSTSATWTPSSNPLTSGSDVYIRNELRIKAGTNLKIENMNFYFAPEAKVVGEKGSVNDDGAKLEIRNNTVFTADIRCSENNIASCGQFGEECDKDYWLGVIVEGDDALPQPPGSATKQGRFSMRTNAMIEYAHDAVLAEGGAVVEVQDSRIKDNYRGITFLPYIATSGMSEIFNRSFIKRSDFTATNDYFESKSMAYFVKTTSISGMYISGNYFANLNTLLTNYSKGIYSINSRLVVGPDNSAEVQSEFLNLDYGFYGMNSSHNTRLVQINYNLFNNNFIGVFLNNHLNPMVLDNDFNIPAKSSATGLYLLGSTGYEVENNYFETYNNLSFNQRNTGIYVESSGEHYNEIYRNFFTRLSFGGRVSKNNVDPGANNENEVGLDWLCNEFDAPLFYSDISLLSSASMSDEQGECLPEPAGNLFSQSSLTVNPNHYDLLSGVGAVSPIDYNHHGNTGTYPRLLPVRYSGQGGGTPAYQLQSCFKNYGKNTCPVKRTGMPSWGDGPSDGGPKSLGESASFESIYEQASVYASAMQEVQNTGQDSGELSEEMKTLNAEVRAFWHDVTIFYQMDTLGVVTSDQMISLLNEFQPASNDRFAAALMGNNTEEWFSDYVNYGSVEISQPVSDNGSLPTDIPEYFEGNFFNNLGNLEALNAYYIENSSYYNPTVQMPDWSLFGETDELPDGNGEGKSMNGGMDASAKIAVHPNPFKDNVTFDLKAYTFEGTNNRLEFYDLLGKKVYELAINENQVNAIIQGNKLAQGIILFTLFVNDNPVENGKILRVK